jgi:hypothetical protein
MYWVEQHEQVPNQPTTITNKIDICNLFYLSNHLTISDSLDRNTEIIKQKCSVFRDIIPCSPLKIN